MEASISELTAIWGQILKNLKEKINDSMIYENFFAHSYLDHIEGNTMIIITDSGVSANVLRDNFLSLIKEATTETTGTEFDFKFYQEGDLKNEVKTVETKPVFFINSSLSQRYTFKNFVVGPSNREAYQASLIVSKKPGEQYNPLFIYGDSGLGKTHLLHAIGNSIKENRPSLKVLYCTAPDFVDEFVKFARGDTTGESLTSYFRTSVDVFLIDDIQFLVGKKGTMEEFFIAFSSLYSQGKQIVITSDMHPNNLDGLDQRLKTRFIQGLTLSIEKPDLLTSEEILRMRINAEGLDIKDFDDDAIVFLATKFSSSIRELEEGLNRLLFYTINIKPTKHVDLEIAKEAVQGLVKAKSEKEIIDERKIVEVVADYYNLTPSQINGKVRTSQIALARHISMYLMRALLDTPLVKIGKAVGNKDHTTVMNGIAKVENMLKTDEQLQKAISELKTRLKA